MGRWEDFAAAAPELADRVRGRFTANRHQVLASLRTSGSPRLSGIEVSFVDGDVWVGSMPGSAKGRDLRRDGRFALHSAPTDEELIAGDAVLEGAARLTDAPEVWAAILAKIAARQPAPAAQEGEQSGEQSASIEGDLFRLELTRVALVRVEGGLLVTESWTPERGAARTERT